MKVIMRSSNKMGAPTDKVDGNKSNNAKKSVGHVDFRQFFKNIQTLNQEDTGKASLQKQLDVAQFTNPVTTSESSMEQGVATSTVSSKVVAPTQNKTSGVPPITPSKRESESSPVRTYRLPSRQGRRSLLFRIGNQLGRSDAEKIFDATQISTRTYREWRIQATAQLPSVTGGPPIEKLTDVLSAAPALQKEPDPRQVHKKIIRLSIDSNEQKVPAVVLKRKSSVSRDYTKVREVVISIGGDEEEGIKPRKSGDTDLQMDDDETSFDEDALLEFERKQAGIDINAKINVLKHLAEHLSNKRKIRQSLVNKATGFTVLDEEQIPLKEHILYLIADLHYLMHDVITYFTIWEKQIREINGRFGTVVANYFVWVRKMVGLEMLAFILTTSIVIIPQMMEEEEAQCYNKRPQRPFHIADLINGERYFDQSYLYYSGYHQHFNGETSNPFKKSAFRFIFCILIMFLLLTYFIFSRLTKYYQSIRMESTVSGVANMQNFKTIICGWDYSCRDAQAKIYLHKTIRREMKMLAETTKQFGKPAILYEAEDKKFLAFAIKHFGLFWGPWALHIVGNVLIILACVIMGLILYEFCYLKLAYYVHCVAHREDDIVRNLSVPFYCPNGDEYLYTWILSLPALFASITSLLLTKFIVMVGDYETFTTVERKIYAAMVRAGLFNFTNIMVFYSFWISHKAVLMEEGFAPETIFGKELYRLVVIQGMTDVFLNLVVKGVYHLVCRKSKAYKMTEFRTEYGTLNMFFVHSVSRIGTLFCPPLSIFVVLRLVVDYYQNRFSLIHLSSQEGYFAHASQVYAPYLLTFFILCYLITSFMNVFYLSDTTPSSLSGPFKQYDTSYDQAIGDFVKSTHKIHWLNNLHNPAFLYIMVVILAALAYFCREWASAYEPISVKLNNLITMERADRDLLLKAIFEIGKATTEDFEKLPMRKSALFVTSPPEISEREDVMTDGEEDKADQQIDELILHVRRRKSALYTDYEVRRKSDIQHGGLSRDEQKRHMDHVEAIVAKIVDARKTIHHVDN